MDAAAKRKELGGVRRDTVVAGQLSTRLATRN